MNYFELFSLPVTLLINQKELKNRFYVLSRKYHPDFYTQESDEEKEDALLMSSQINTAYKILQNPDETLEYVLQLKGVISDDEKYQLPPDFLMEMMEINELMEEAKSTQNKDSLVNAERSIQSFENDIYQGVKDIIEGYDDTKIKQQELAQLKDYFFKKKYLKRILATM